MRKPTIKISDNAQIQLELNKQRNKLNTDIYELYLKLDSISINDIINGNVTAQQKHDEIIEQIKEKQKEIYSINTRLHYYKKNDKK